MLVKRISLSVSQMGRMFPALVALATLAAACSGGEPAVPGASPPATSPPSSPTATLATVSEPPQSTAVPSVAPAARNRRVNDPNEYGFSPLLGFDSIRPIYDPEFAGAAEAPLIDDELVIGFSLGGEAKAYPITVLRSREMVNDELAGIPILVTW